MGKMKLLLEVIGYLSSFATACRLLRMWWRTMMWLKEMAAAGRREKAGRAEKRSHKER